MTKLASTMRFVWVNDRAPGPPSTCAHCRTSVTTGYLRELSSQLPYCDHACYLGRRNETAPMVWRTGAGIDGLPIRGLPGLGNCQGTLLGIMGYSPYEAASLTW